MSRRFFFIFILSFQNSFLFSSARVSKAHSEKARAKIEEFMEEVRLALVPLSEMAAPRYKGNFEGLNARKAFIFFQKGLAVKLSEHWQKAVEKHYGKEKLKGKIFQLPSGYQELEFRLHRMCSKGLEYISIIKGRLQNPHWCEEKAQARTERWLKEEEQREREWQRRSAERRVRKEKEEEERKKRAREQKWAEEFAVRYQDTPHLQNERFLHSVKAALEGEEDPSLTLRLYGLTPHSRPHYGRVGLDGVWWTSNESCLEYAKRLNLPSISFLENWDYTRR